MKLPLALVPLLGLASALPTVYDAGQYHKKATNNSIKLLVASATGRINALSFDGSKFNILSTLSTGTGTNPSWTAFKSPNLLYATNENANTLLGFTYDRATDKFANLTSNNGSTGVVHLEFSADKTVLTGAGFTNGTVDFYDASAADGKLALLNTVTLKGALGPLNASQLSVQAHQSIRDPSDRYLVVPSRGADRVFIIDTHSVKDAASVAIVTDVEIRPAGCGPRHGAFVAAADGKTATHFVLVCEMANLVQLFSVEYPAAGGMTLTHQETRSTFGDDMPSKNPTTTTNDATKKFAAAGEVVVAKGKDSQHVYVSNRITGNPTDSIAHFELMWYAGGKACLQYRESVSSEGISPRQFSLSTDAQQQFLFSTNMANGTGLVAFKRDSVSGKLAVIAESKVGMEKFRDDVTAGGPEFVMQI